jgi:hypothetical protein
MFDALIRGTVEADFTVVAGAIALLVVAATWWLIRRR